MNQPLYIAPNATVVGDVTLGKDVNIWYGAVIRGDHGAIVIGEGTNVQDNAIVHDETTVGKYCTIGHGAIVHGCRIGDNCTIGMGAIVLSGAVLGDNCLVGAGAVVTGKMHAEDGSLLLGSPAKVVKPLTPQQIQDSLKNAQHYVHLGREAFGPKPEDDRKNAIFTLCQSLNMPQPVTEEILALLPGLPLSLLQPAMNKLFQESTWEEGLELLKQQLAPDPRGIKMLTCMLICALETQKAYAEKGIPEDIFLATMDCFPRFVKEHMVSFGCYGFDRDFWTVRQLSCVLFRTGLLEYELREGKISLHIPTGAHLLPEAIDASLTAAHSFLARFFPAWADVPMDCHSWLLSPQLPELLDPDSKIIRFQNRFRITAEPEQTEDFLEWVFKNKNIPYAQLPENTSLQKKMKQYLLQGGIFVEGRGILI